MSAPIKFVQSLLVLSSFLGATSCLSFGADEPDENTGVIGTSAVQPAQFAPDECTRYLQLKRDAEYLCELADGSTRPLKQGERRTTPLSKIEIAQVMQSNSEDSEACLQAAREADPKAHGKIYLKFEIESDGRIAEVAYQKDKSTYKNDTLGKCLESKIKSWKFPVLRNDESLEISYPFILMGPDLN